MATVASEIVDLFLTRVNDYRLTTIYQTSGSTSLTTYIEPWLIDSIVEFDICTQDLTYTATSGSVEGSFTQDLNIETKSILSQIMVKYWMAKAVQDILQMNNFVQDHDYKTMSVSQNLTAKMNYYNTKKEEISQILENYGFKYLDWSRWRNQLFYTP